MLANSPEKGPWSPGVSATSGVAPAPPKCRRCGIALTDANWTPYRQRPTHDYRCTPCFRAENSSKRAAAKRRTFESIGTGRVECYRCGVTDLRILELDHLGGGGSQEHRAARQRGGDINPYVRTLKMIAGGSRSRTDYRVLCRLCNALDYLERKFPDLKGCATVSWSGAAERETHPRPTQETAMQTAPPWPREAEAGGSG